MTSVVIRAVLFDFGGVISEEGFYNGLINLAEKQALDARSIPQQGMDAAYDSGFVLGKGSVSDFWGLMRQRTGIQGDDNYLSDRIFDGFQIRPLMIKLVRMLRDKHYITGLLSDQTHWLDELNECDHFYKEFDYVFNSYVMGKGKRDPSVFTDVADSLKLMPAEILFIDDNIKNISNAKSVDLNTIHYRDYYSLVQEIESLLHITLNA